MRTAEGIGPPLLTPGQRLSQAEFHERYKATHPDFRAELIGGLVHIRGRVTARHGSVNHLAVYWVVFYDWRTPGVQGGCHGSTILDSSAEVHPDAKLRLSAERGGRTRVIDDMLHGAPELIVEVADDSKEVDLGPKLHDYERAGTLEYVVIAINPDEVFWHVRRQGKLVRVRPDPDGLYRSKVFPGLWLDPIALLANDGLAVTSTLERGLASDEHAAFLVAAQRS